MSSAKNFVEDSVKTTVNNLILSISNHLSAQLATKDIEMSPEEICALFNVTYRPASTPSYNTGASVQTQIPNLPGYLTGAGVSPAVKKRGGRTKKTADPNGSTCKYVLSRGDKQGEKCGKPVAADGSLGADEYCKGCLKKTAVKSILEAPSSKATVNPPVLPDSNVKIQESNEDVKEDTLNVVPLEGKEGYYRETRYGYIIQQAQNGDIICCGIEDGKGGKRSLTQDEKNRALNMGMQVPQEEVAVQIPVANIPQVPQVGNFASTQGLIAQNRS
jgi:hypothetical protein